MLSAKDIRDAINSAPKLKAEPVPAWGGTVYVCNMNAHQRDNLDLAWGSEREGSDGVGYRAYVVAWCLCDEDNTPMFRGDELAPMVDMLNTERAAMVDRLFETAARLNGIMPEDEAAAVKN
jgi:hypothetical protein